MPNKPSRSRPLRLPSDFLGTVQALLHTPPPPKRKKPKAKKAKKRSQRAKG
jgi:hypothetical protein